MLLTHSLPVCVPRQATTIHSGWWRAGSHRRTQRHSHKVGPIAPCDEIWVDNAGSGAAAGVGSGVEEVGVLEYQIKMSFMTLILKVEETL